MWSNDRSLPYLAFFKSLYHDEHKRQLLKNENNVNNIGNIRSFTTCYNQNWTFDLKKSPLSESTRAKMNNLINVVNNLLQCCAAPCQQLLSTTIVHSCSRSTTIVQSLLTTFDKLFSSTIVSSCSNNIVATIVLCQHRTTIDQTIFINIVNSTSVVEL